MNEYFNLHLIAQDLIYYGYDFNYFVDNYGKDVFSRDKLKKIWEEQIRRMERI